MKAIIKKYIMNFVWIFLFAFLALYFSLKGEFYLIMDTVRNAKVNWIIVAFMFMVAYNLLEGYALAIFGLSLIHI